MIAKHNIIYIMNEAYVCVSERVSVFFPREIVDWNEIMIADFYWIIWFRYLGKINYDRIRKMALYGVFFLRLFVREKKPNVYIKPSQVIATNSLVKIYRSHQTFTNEITKSTLIEWNGSEFFVCL